MQKNYTLSIDSSENQVFDANTNQESQICALETAANSNKFRRMNKCMRRLIKWMLLFTKLKGGWYCYFQLMNTFEHFVETENISLQFPST